VGALLAPRTHPRLLRLCLRVETHFHIFGTSSCKTKYISAGTLIFRKLCFRADSLVSQDTIFQSFEGLKSRLGSEVSVSSRSEVSVSSRSEVSVSSRSEASVSSRPEVSVSSRHLEVSENGHVSAVFFISLFQHPNMPKGVLFQGFPVMYDQ